MDFEQITILVTGANRGLGLEFCSQLSPSGATIWAAHRGESPGNLSSVCSRSPQTGSAHFVSM